MNNKEFTFFVYLVESYARYKNTDASSVLKTFKAHKLTEFIFDMYEIYHTEDLRNAFLDIDSLLKAGTPLG